MRYADLYNRKERLNLTPEQEKFEEAARRLSLDEEISEYDFISTYKDYREWRRANPGMDMCVIKVVKQ